MKKLMYLLVGAGIVMCLILVGRSRVFAQETITGTVLSAGDGSPLPGATIVIAGTGLGTNTDENGRFKLSGSGSELHLSITFLGYLPLDTNVRLPLTKPLILFLRTDASLLEQVVVSTGYQQLSPERTTGSFTQPDSVMFQARVSTDVISRLEGITNGLLFNSPGILGSEELLAIRGRSTIYANSQPLIVVDNFPYEGDINNINPNDVESITVLKDAAAASIWGARSGNGVIVITTKRGRKNAPAKVSFNVNTTISDKPDLFYDPHFINSSDFIDLEMDLYEEGFYEGDIGNSRRSVISPVVALLHQVTQGALTEAEASAEISEFRSRDVRDALSEYFYRPAVNQQYILSVSGGSNTNSYYMSAGYDRNQSMIRGNDFSRLTLNFSNAFNPFKNLTLTAGINYVQNTNTIDNSLASTTSSFNGVILPYTSIADDDGNPLPVITGYSPLYTRSVQERGFLDWRFYPLDELNNGYDVTKGEANDIRLTGGVDYLLYKGLTVSIKYQYQRTNNLSKNLSMQESYFTRNLINRFSALDAEGNVAAYNIPLGDILTRGSSVTTANNIRGQFDYADSWGHHRISGIGGVEAREIIGESESSWFYGYDDATATYGSVNTTTLFQLNPSSFGSISNGLGAGGTTDRFRSFYANAAYTYKERYTVSASGRIDQSNLFGVRANQRSVPLWSTGGKWDISSEPFYRLDWLPKLNLRVTYGYNGNMDKSVTAVTTFRLRGVPSRGITTQQYATISNLGNPNLRWEKMGMLNLGIDFVAIDGILSGSIEYFRKNGTDLMGDELMPRLSGIEVLRGNYAEMKGKGIDVRLRSRNIFRNHFSWETSLLFSWAVDKVTDYSVEPLPQQLLSTGTSIRPHIGKPVYSITTLKWAGLDPETGAPRGYDEEGNISTDYSQLRRPESESALIYHGPARPTIFGGLRNTLKYGNLSLSFNISYKLGHYFIRDGINYGNLFSSYKMHKDYLQRWQEPGDELSTEIPSLVYPQDRNRDSFYYLSEVLVEKGDHIRLRDISLSYNLKSSWFGKQINRLQLFAYMNNVGLLWKATDKDLDPDYPTGGIVPPRTIAFGLKAQF